MDCPNCHHEITNNDMICSNCGHKVNKQTELSKSGLYQESSTPKAKVPAWGWMMTVFIVAAVGVFVIVYGDQVNLGFRIGSRVIRVSDVDGMKMSYVPAGEFSMGATGYSGLPDEAPVHTVHLDAYWIDRVEVTNTMFARFVKETGHKTEAEITGGSWVFTGRSWEQIDGASWRHPQGLTSDIDNLGNYPVVHVSWRDAQAYCEWANRRLPTEAEWERAAKGTGKQRYPWGENPPNNKQANFADQSLGVDWAEESINDEYGFSAPVGSYQKGASPTGALDMAGNVYEWVFDWYDWTYYQKSPKENPLGPEFGDQRVIRGGSWISNSHKYRVSARVALDPTYTLQDTGFRCVMPVQ